MISVFCKATGAVLVLGSLCSCCSVPQATQGMPAAENAIVHNSEGEFARAYAAVLTAATGTITDACGDSMAWSELGAVDYWSAGSASKPAKQSQGIVVRVKKPGFEDETVASKVADVILSGARHEQCNVADLLETHKDSDGCLAFLLTVLRSYHGDHEPAILEHARRALARSKDSVLRITALEILASRGGKEDVALADRMTNASDEYVRSAAKRALDLLRQKGAGKDKQ